VPALLRICSSWNVHLPDGPGRFGRMMVCYVASTVLWHRLIRIYSGVRKW
jgi:hypothetical protein